ncbi:MULTISPECIES: hypothetical protein [unclassified Streptomyces]|uniref:hypothetical protein n=1 Tax=unclassified Streptomyces TaxID=2593676 RepID=UPI0033254D76
MKAVAAVLGTGVAKAMRTWVRRAEVDAAQRPGATSEEAAEIKRLRAENAGPRRANQILKAAPAFFAAELDRSSKRSWRSATHTAGCSESSRSAGS